MNKICVYTCITGNYDDVKELTFKEKGIDYYLFTNNSNITSDTWNVVYIENDQLDNIRLARKIKTLGHDIIKKYDVTVWVDGATTIRNSVKEFIKKYCDFTKYSLVGFKHSKRDCIYDEAIEIARLKKDKYSVVNKQINEYKKQHYPAHNGLIESTVLFRKNGDKLLDKTMKMWFKEICNYSYRDQLSFNYVAYLTKLNYKLLDMNVFDNEYFGWEKHFLKKNLNKYYVYFDFDKDFNNQSYLCSKYSISQNKYIAKFKVKKNCSEIKFEFTNCKGIKFSNLKINAVNMINHNLTNYSRYFDTNIFDNDIPTLFLYGKFEKNDSIMIEIEMSCFTEDDYLDLLKRFNLTLIDAIKIIETKSTSKFSLLKNKIKNKISH